MFCGGFSKWSLFCSIISLTQGSSPLCSANPSSSPTTPSATSIPPCSVSAEELASGRSVQGSSSRADGQIPSWVNLTLARQGQAFAINKIGGGFFSAFFGLLGGTLTIPDIRDVLVFTNNSGAITTAAKRYVATGTQFLLWYQDSLKLDLDENAFVTSIANVRSIHLAAAQTATAHGLPLVPPALIAGVKTDDTFWNAFHADLVSSKIPTVQRTFGSSYNAQTATAVPLNQFALASTQFGFMGYLILNPAKMYLYDASDDDLTSLLHLWAIIGYGLGIDDQYNICLQPDLASAKIYFQQLHELHVIPSLFNIQKGSKILIEALIGGLQNYFPTLGLGLRSFLVIYLRDVIGIPVTRTMSVMTLLERAEITAFDTTFVPGTHVPDFQAGGSVAAQSVVQAAIIPFFGPYFTNMDKATYVFYNSSNVY